MPVVNMTCQINAQVKTLACKTRVWWCVLGNENIILGDQVQNMNIEILCLLVIV